MEEKKRLPDAELAVMQAVWAQSGEVGRADIEGALASHGWSANTLNTYLTRLYGGSLGSFVAALNAEQPLEQREIDELRQFLDDMSR